MGPPRLPYRPPSAHYLGGFDVNTPPITRNPFSRKRVSTVNWRGAIERGATSIAAGIKWSPTDRYAVVIEIRIPRIGDIDNYLKDMLDRSARCGVFGSQDERVDLVHAIKKSGVAPSDGGARIEIWRLEGTAGR